jgi:hypothetical protein
MLRKASLLLTVFLLLQALSATPWSSAQPSEQEPQATAETPSAGAAPGAGEETTAGDETTSPPELVQSALEGVPPDGNYVLFFVGVLWSVGLLALIVMTGFGGWLQRLVERLTRRPNLKVALFAALYTLIVFIGSFPLSIYGGFMREKQFGFANQTFPQWMGDQGKALLVSIFLQVIFFTILYVAIRRLDRNW